MRRTVFVVGALLVLAWTSAPLVHADEDRVRVEASVEPPRGIVVGARAALVVKISAAAVRFDGTPSVEEPQIPFAVVRRLDQSTIKGTEKVGGKDWIYQIWTFDLWPSRAGMFEAPALRVVVKLPGTDDADPVVVRTKTNAVSFEVRTPERGENATYALAARGFEIEESLDRSLDGLKVGDAVRRTITMRVEDAPGMLIPPVASGEAQPGLGEYADTPVVEDRFNRGDLTGVRTETITYVMEAEGRYVLPEMRVPWWNLVPGALEEAVLAGHEITVAENPDLDPEQAARLAREADEGGTDTSRGRRLALALAILGWILGLLVLVLLGRRLWHRYGPAIERRMAARRRARHESEEAYFRHFVKACGTNDPKTAEEALRRWLDRAHGTATTLEAFVTSAHDDGLTRAVSRLEQTLYGVNAGDAWTGADLAGALARVRRGSDAAEAGENAALRLNPRGSTR